MQYGYGYFEEDKLGEVTDINLWRRILSYTSHFWQGMALAAVLSFAVIGSSLLLPYLVRLGVDDYVINTQIPLAERFSGLTRDHRQLFPGNCTGMDRPECHAQAAPAYI